MCAFVPFEDDGKPKINCSRRRGKTWGFLVTRVGVLHPQPVGLIGLAAPCHLAHGDLHGSRHLAVGEWCHCSPDV